MIEITESAARQINKLLARQEMTGGGLRVALRAGGCSGYQYTFSWEKDPRPDDHVFVGSGDARVFVDPKSFRLLDGVVLDFDTNPVGKGFMFQNPNAKSTCGCGTSFSV